MELNSISESEDIFIYFDGIVETILISKWMKMRVIGCKMKVIKCRMVTRHIYMIITPRPYCNFLRPFKKPKVASSHLWRKTWWRLMTRGHRLIVALNLKCSRLGPCTYILRHNEWIDEAFTGEIASDLPVTEVRKCTKYICKKSDPIKKIRP